MNNYFRFFESNNAPFLLESIYVKHYSDFKCVSFRKNNIVNIIFTNYNKSVAFEKMKEWFFSEDFNIWCSNFISFLEKASLLSSEAINNENGVLLADLLLEFLSYYRMTESFYTDGIYSILDKNKLVDISYRMGELERLKLVGRKYLNSFFNGSDSFINMYTNKKAYYSEQSYYNLLNNSFDISDRTIFIRQNNHLLLSDDTIKFQDDNTYKDIEKWIDNIYSNQEKIIYGVSASSGIYIGKAYVLSADFSNYSILTKLIEEMPLGSILVSETTAPDLILACHKAKAIVTNQGGLGSHAAIVSRELKIPCVVGTIKATHTIKTGDLLIVNGYQGTVRISE